MVNTEKDTIDIAAGGEVDTAATITPAKKVVAPVNANGSGEQEEEDTRRATVPTSGGVEATINGTGEKQQEKGATGADSAEAQAARLLQFEQKKKDLQRAFIENQRQLAESFVNQEQTLVDQPEQAATAAAAAAATAAAVAGQAAAGLSDKEPEVLASASDVALDELTLTVAEQSLLDYHADDSSQLVSPASESAAGISPAQLQGLLAVTSQKYCVALCLNNSLHLLHSAFMVGTEVCACTSKGGINGEQYVRFDQSEFCRPMAGLLNPAFFAGKADLVRQIPTTTDLLAAETLDSFIATTPTLNEVHLNVAGATARPASMILLSGELYYSLVSAFGVPAEEYGFKCEVLEALLHIKSVAKAEETPERYNSFMYFLVASAQGLNPSKSTLAEVPPDSAKEGIMKQQLKVRLKDFLQFQLGDIDSEEEDASSPTVTGVATQQAV